MPPTLNNEKVNDHELPCSTSDYSEKLGHLILRTLQIIETLP